MTTRRITIASDGTVKLRGRPTKYQLQRMDRTTWRLFKIVEHGAVYERRIITDFVRENQARAWLAAGSDEELLA